MNENITPYISDAAAYAAADERFELEQERERTLRWGPIIRCHIRITDADREAGEQDIKANQRRYSDMLSDDEWHELMELRIMQSYVDELDYNNADIP